jgi:hypothetical protein
MKSQLLTEILEKLTADINSGISICPRARDALQFDIGKTYRFYGLNDDASKYIGVVALAPVENLPGGIPLGVDPKEEFSDYVQFESGLAVPRWIAEKTDLEFNEYNYPRSLRIAAGYFTPEIFKDG